MTDPNFDWTATLPETEQKAILAKRETDREAFFKGFPTVAAFNEGYKEGAADAADGDLLHALECRTTERNYHKRMADKLADIINELRPALVEAERFMEYFAGETGGTFVGAGTPQSCLAQIRKALAVPNGDRDTEARKD